MGSRSDSDCSSSSDGSEVADFSSVFGGGRFKQQCLRRYGFTSSFEQQLHRDRYTTLDGIHEAWGVVLQQHARDIKLLCRLLCVSRGLRSLVMLSCAGRLEVEFDFDACETTKDPYLQSFARFLARQAPLIGTLSLFGEVDRNVIECGPYLELQEVVAVAIREAGAAFAPTYLCLGNYMSLLLQQVASLSSCRAGLIELDLHQGGGLRPSEAQPFVDALSRLTSLKSLTFKPTGLRNVNKLLPGLAGLTQLTYLSAGLNRLADLGRHLPVSLRELKIGAWPLKSDPKIGRKGDLLPPVEAGTLRPFSLKLAHLTALTELDCINSYEGVEDDYDDDWEYVYRGDELPPNISNLRAAVMHGGALAVLQPLSNLTFLELRHAGTTASHLRCLTVLSNLQTLELKEFKPPLPPSSDSEDDDEKIQLDSPDAYCEAWPLFPIKQISLHCELTPLTLQQLGSVTGLTKLSLRIAMDSSATRQQLGAALRPLRQLQSLELEGEGGGVRSVGDFLSSAHSPQWVTALGNGSSLTSLKVRGLFLPRASMDCMPLQHHTGLQRLELLDCELDDYGVSCIAPRLTGLCELSLSDNMGVTNAAVRQVASHLQQLRRLNVHRTSVTDASVEWLLMLQQLTHVQPLQLWCDRVTMECDRVTME